MKKVVKRMLLSALSFLFVVALTIGDLGVYASAGTIDSSVYHSVKPDTSVYKQTAKTDYFVAGSFADAKEYVENSGNFDNCDYIYYETQTETCYHYYAYHMPSTVISAGQSYTVNNVINGANNKTARSVTFTAPYQGSSTQGGPYANSYTTDKVSHNLWYYWYFTIEAVAYNSVDKKYENTICTTLGYDQGRTMPGGLLNGWRTTGGFDNMNQWIWGSNVGYHGGTVDYRYSPVGGYGIHMTGVCYCHRNTNINPYFGNGSACLADGYSHTTTMYRFTGYELSCITITADKKSGTGGTDKFYEYYGVSFNKTVTPTDKITSIYVPSKIGYTFGGYYNKDTGTGGKTLPSNATKVVDESGNILVNNKFWSSNGKIYAYWIPNKYTVNVYNNKPSSSSGDIVNIK